MTFGPAKRIVRLEMPERTSVYGAPLRHLERDLERAPIPDGWIDATYANTHVFPPDSWVSEAFARAAGGEGMTYTPYRGDAGVRRHVASNVGGWFGADINPDREVILTPGTQAGLYSALSAIVDPGDLVLVPDPDYITSERSVRYLDAQVVSIPMTWPVDGDPRLDLEALRAGVSQGAKLLMFSHPNNPTGAVFSTEHLSEIAEIVAGTDTLVLVDQLYARLVYDDREFTHFATLPDMWERTITTVGPSKTESLSGYRIGAAIAPAQIVDRMEDVMGIASLRCPAYAQHILSRWIADDADYVTERTTQYAQLRDLTVERLRAMPGVTVNPARGSAYVYPSFAGLDVDTQTVALDMKTKAGIVVNPAYQFGSLWTQNIRLCFAQDHSQWTDALDRMASVFATYRTTSA